jgi:hypothetical protein
MRYYGNSGIIPTPEQGRALLKVAAAATAKVFKTTPEEVKEIAATVEWVGTKW